MIYDGLRPLLEVILYRLLSFGARWLSVVRSTQNAPKSIRGTMSVSHNYVTGNLHLYSVPSMHELREWVWLHKHDDLYPICKIIVVHAHIMHA